MGRSIVRHRSTKPAIRVALAFCAANALAVGCTRFGPGPDNGPTAAVPGSYEARPWAPRPSDRGPSFGASSFAGPIQPEPSTPHALAMRWPIQGDDNGNARVEVAYRRAGEVDWRTGFPLFWVHPGGAPDYLRVPGGRLFAGSIVDLDPGMAYEIRLALVDPDGGSETRTLTLETTREPAEPSGLKTRHVVARGSGRPGPGTGSESDPFVGLDAALARARPGEVILVHAGHYQAGGTRLTRSGEPGRPIIIRATGNGNAVLDGGGEAILIDLSGLRHVWLERLTLRNADALVLADGASHLVVRRNRFEVQNKNLAVGIGARHARDDESQGFFITDNVFVGPNTWPRKSRRKSTTEQIFGIAVTGAGHVVAYNVLRGFGDGINNGRGGRLSSSDIHNNDISDSTDDCIEADHSTTNLRVFRNRLTNCFAGVSAQPIHGGPAYVFRNFILNTQYTPFKLHNHTSGLLLFHNTSVKSGIPFNIQPARETVNDVITRNNVFIGTEGPALRSTGRMRRCDFDNDGYDWVAGDFALWNGRRHVIGSSGRLSDGPYVRRGVILLDHEDTFLSGLEPPWGHEVRQEPVDNDPRLAPDSAAVDRGVALANFNDHHRGAAPDLGCCEAGVPLPHVGPRPEAGS